MPMAHANVQKITCITTNNTTDVSIVHRTTTQTEAVNAMKACSMMTGNATTAQQTTMLTALANVPKAPCGW